MINSNNYSFKYLDWDTDYFGVKSGKIELFNEVTTHEQREILEILDAFEFTTICNFNNNNENNSWIGERLTASLKDVNVQFNLQLKEQNHDFSFNGNLIVRNNLEIDEDILDMASKLFLFSRFYNDSKLSKSKSANIYRQWALNAFNRETKYFICYKYGDRTIGFILFNLDSCEARIELIAVDKQNTRKGIGSKMISFLKYYLRNSGIDFIKVGTQANNISAINFYISLGFRYSFCTSVYHYWK